MLVLLLARRDTEQMQQVLRQHGWDGMINTGDSEQEGAPRSVGRKIERLAQDAGEIAGK